MRLLAALAVAIVVYAIVRRVTDSATPGRQLVIVRKRPTAARQPSLTGRSLAAAVAVLVVLFALTGSFVFALVPAVAVALAPRSIERRREERRRTERMQAWPEGLRDLLAHLRVGLSLHRGLCELGGSGPAALRPVWRRYERDAVALDARVALERVRVELADPVSDRIIELLLTAQEHGADAVVALLAAMAESVTKDLALDESIVTGQTEIRAQAVAAVALPFVVLAFLIVSNPGYRSFYRSSGGAFVIVLGALMAAGGWKLITVLGRLPREPRVLDGSVRS